MPTFERRQQPRRVVHPDERQILAEGFQERCGHCWWIWPSSMMVEEDGIRLCPNGANHVTATMYAEGWQLVADKIEAYQPEPQISQAPLRTPIPPVVNAITDASGLAVYSSQPLHLTRGTPAVLRLVGLHFSASDTITYAPGITNAAPVSRPSTSLTILTVVADPSMTPSDHYSLTFNGDIFRDVFSVR